MHERLTIPGIARSGVEIVNPKDQREITRAIREQQRKATDPEFREGYDRLNTWADRLKYRFFDGVLRLDRAVLPDPIIGIDRLRINTLASYRLNRNELASTTSLPSTACTLKTNQVPAVSPARSGSMGESTAWWRPRPTRSAISGSRKAARPPSNQA